MLHLPLAIRKEKPKSGLVIAMGIGTSLRSMASWGIQVKCVELVPSVIKAMPYFYGDAQWVLNQPNVKVIVDDGRRFLKRTREKFDVIVIDPPPPVESASTSLLYSKEFNKIVAGRLNEGGIFQQWFPMGEEKIFQAVLRSLTEVFPYVRSFKSLEGWGFHLLASMKPFETPQAEEMFSRLPAMAKRDLMEWETKMDIKDYLNLTLKREIPVDNLLNRRTPLPYDPYLDSDYSSLSRNHSTTLVHYISLTTDPLTNTFWSAGFVTNVPEFIVIYNNYFFTKPGSGP